MRARTVVVACGLAVVVTLGIAGAIALRSPADSGLTGSAIPPGEYPVATGPPVSVEVTPTTVPPPPVILPGTQPAEPVP